MRISNPKLLAKWLAFSFGLIGACVVLTFLIVCAQMSGGAPTWGAVTSHAQSVASNPRAWAPPMLFWLVISPFIGFVWYDVQTGDFL